MDWVRMLAYIIGTGDQQMLLGKVGQRRASVEADLLR